MASTLQTLFALPTFQERYLTSFFTHTTSCYADPSTCFECQMSKVADGLLSGRYSVPRVAPPATDSTDTPGPIFQEGIRPIMFKSLVGKGHSEFSTMKQQDAGEFMKHLFEVIQRSSKSLGTEDPTSIFRFAVEEKLQCSECRGVRYKTTEEDSLEVKVPAKVLKAASGDDKVEYEPVQLLASLENYMSTSETDDWMCPQCDKKVTVYKSVRPSLPLRYLLTMGVGLPDSQPSQTS